MVKLDLTDDELKFLAEVAWKVSASGNMARVLVSLQDKLTEALKFMENKK